MGYEDSVSAAHSDSEDNAVSRDHASSEPQASSVQMPPSYTPPVKRNRAQFHDGQKETGSDSGVRKFSRFLRRPPSSTPLIDGEQPMVHRFISGFIQTVTILAVALLCTVLIKTFLIQSYYVPSGSMETTIMTGDYVMVNKLADEADEIHRGDIVVFQDPGGWLSGVQEYKTGKISAAINKIGQAIGLVPKNSGTHLVKRVIAIGGDKVTCCDDQGRIKVNGTSITEPYVRDGVAPSETEFDVTVPEGYLWVMGDNRSNSRDSRAHQAETGFGFVPVNNVEGRAWIVYYPISRFGLMKTGADSFEDVPEKSS